MRRSRPISWQHAPVSVYRDAVDLRLRETFGRSAQELFAETAVGAAQRVGMTPQECISWLSEVDGLS
jgi:hypothetical protein